MNHLRYFMAILCMVPFAMRAASELPCAVCSDRLQLAHIWFRSQVCRVLSELAHTVHGDDVANALHLEEDKQRWYEELARLNGRSLWHAAGRGHEGCIRALLAHAHCDIGYSAVGDVSAIVQALGGAHESCALLLLTHERYAPLVMLPSRDLCRTVLHEAVLARQPGVVRFIMGNERYRAWLQMPDGCGRMPLHYAAQQNNVECAQVLLQDELEGDALANARDGCGATVLGVAAACGSQDVISLLERTPKFISWAACNRRGDTPLHEAVRMGHVCVVQQLVAPESRFTEVDAVTEKQESALHVAVKGQRWRCALALLGRPSKYAAVNGCDCEDASPLQHAIRQRAPVEVVHSILHSPEGNESGGRADPNLPIKRSVTIPLGPHYYPGVVATGA